MLITCSQSKALAWQEKRLDQSQESDCNEEIEFGDDPTVLAEDLGEVSAMEISPCGEYLALALQSNHEIWILHIRSNGVGGIGDVDHVATLGDNTGSTVAALHFLPCPTDFDRDSTSMLLSVGYDGSLRIYCLPSFASVFESTSPLPGHYQVNSSCLLENYVMALGNTNGDVQLLELAQHQEQVQVKKIGVVNLRAMFTKALSESDEASGSETVSANSRSYLKDGIQVSCEILDLAPVDRNSVGTRCPRNNSGGQSCSSPFQTGSSTLDSILELPPLLLVATNLGFALVNAKSRDILTILLFQTMFSGGTLYGTMMSKIKMTHTPAPGNGFECVGKRMITSTSEKMEPVAFTLSFAENINETSVMDRQEEIETLKSSDLIHESDLLDEGSEKLIEESLEVIAKVSVKKDSFLDLSNRKTPPLTSYDILKKGTKKLFKFTNQSASSRRRVRSSGYGTEKPRQNLFQPKINHYRRGQQSSLPPALVLPTCDTTTTKQGLTRRPRWETKTVLMGSSSLLKKDQPVIYEFPPARHARTIQVWPDTDGVRSKISFSGHGKFFATAAYGMSADNTVQVYPSPSSNKKEPVTLLGHSGQIRSLDFSHGSENLMLSVGDDRIVKFWHWPSRHCKMNVDSKSGGFNKALNEFGGVFLSSKSESSNLSGVGAEPFFPNVVTKSQFYYMDQFLLSSSGNKVFIHQLGLDISTNDSSGNGSKKKKGSTGASTPDNSWYSLSKTLKLSSCKTVLDFSASNRFFSYLVFCACSDKAIRILDLNEQKVCREITNVHQRPVQQIVQPTKSGGNVSSPDLCNLFLTSALGDGAKLWDLRATQRCVQRFDYPGSSSGRIGSGVDFSPCVKFVALGSEDGSVYTYDLRRFGSYLQRLEKGPGSRVWSNGTVSGSSGGAPVTDVKFNPNGSQLLCANQEGEIIVFEH